MCYYFHTIASLQCKAEQDVISLNIYFIFLSHQVRDYDFREHLSTIAPTEQRELVLGNDAYSWSYMYFSIFSAADLRIYKQCPLEVPTLSKRKKKVHVNYVCLICTLTGGIHHVH